MRFRIECLLKWEVSDEVWGARRNGAGLVDSTTIPSETILEGYDFRRITAFATVLVATILGLGETSIVAAATLSGTV
jgi:hypothetical protein